MSTFTVVLIVPTGVGAAIGGYAGDALPVAKAIAEISDRLITHPNVLNGAQLYWPLENTYYVEGYGLDRFAANQWGLHPVRQNKVGLLLDRGIEPELRLRHIQAADATRATLGLNLTDYVITDAPLEVELRTADSGASWGTIGNSGSLLRAAEKLITQGGAEAIAVVARFPDDDSPELQNYRHGAGVDHLAGAEAVISHLIVRNFQIPAAHAPALNPLPVDPEVSPRAAAEELGYTFLPCVLVGLSRAPQFVTAPQSLIPDSIWAESVDAAIVPYSACGGSAILSFSSSPTQIIAVTNNSTQLQVPPEPLGVKVTKVNSYLEALGVLVALRAGINFPVFHPNLSSLRCL
ncbi:MAG: DUF3326 domain-containing protein [Pleurocapsa sp. MO_192.B19]|nr:DUF3326 domain-containing protein [Pleurocapsa sp. MO_192.B19]